MSIDILARGLAVSADQKAEAAIQMGIGAKNLVYPTVSKMISDLNASYAHEQPYKYSFSNISKVQTGSSIYIATPDSPDYWVEIIGDNIGLLYEIETDTALIEGCIKEINEGINIGANNINTRMGFYYSAIDLNEKKIYLSSVQQMPVIGKGTKIEHFGTPAYSIGAVFSIVNNSKYENIATIKSIDKNIIEYEGDLPFSEIIDATSGGIYELDTDDYSFSVVSQPNIGRCELKTKSIVAGQGNYAAGNEGFVTGRANIGYGDYSIVGGYGNQVGYAGFSSGKQNEVGQQSLGYGYLNKATGADALAGGRNSKATAISALAIGEGVEAGAPQAVAFGNKTQVLAANSIGAGAAFDVSNDNINNPYPVTIKKQCSIGVGGGIDSNAQFSAAFGYGISTSVDCSTAVGKYNKHLAEEGESPKLFMVGNGSQKTRSNVFEVRSDGTAWVNNNKKLLTDDDLTIKSADARNFIITDGVLKLKSSLAVGQSYTIDGVMTDTTTSKDSAIAVGGGAQVTDQFGAAFGYGTKAGKTQTAIGMYNKITSNTTSADDYQLLMVGNGGSQKRSNAFEVFRNGDIKAGKGLYLNTLAEEDAGAEIGSLINDTRTRVAALENTGITLPETIVAETFYIEGTDNLDYTSLRKQALSISHDARIHNQYEPTRLYIEAYGCGISLGQPNYGDSIQFSCSNGGVNFSKSQYETGDVTIYPDGITIGNYKLTPEMMDKLLKLADKFTFEQEE